MNKASRFRRRLAVLPLLAALLLLGVFAYHHWVAPTRVALVNYPEYMLAPLLDQELPDTLEAVPLPWHEKSGAELKKFDLVLFFGMGLNFTPEQQKLLAELKSPVFVTSSTRPETAINTLPENQAVRLRKYLANLSKDNFRRMLHFIRNEIDAKKFRLQPTEEPREILRSGFFHASEEEIFRTSDEYWQWYRQSGRYREGAPTVCLLSGNGGGDLGAVLLQLESRGLNVIGASGMGRFLDRIREIKPDAVVYFPHGRLSFDAPDEAVAELRQANIPLFCPLKVNQPYEEFLRDQRGMTGGMLSQSIIMPELDGGAVPFVLSALFRNRRGLLEFRAIPDRLRKFAELVEKTVRLQKKPHAEKKIVIVYYKEPGKNAMVAGGLEVGHSLFNTLRHLRKNGFHTGELPDSPEELNRLIQEQGAVFGSYAAGAQAEFLRRHAAPLTVTREEFHRWSAAAIPDDLRREVVQTHGEFPEKLQLGVLRFGNILLLPQLAAGSGDSENQIVHGVKQIPPYPYLASYFYCRFGFQADALLHFGTHGSLEFTPWKQAALSSYDWPDILIGGMPHYYLYVINNVGEALIAKRRSYAITISHLTAPFMNAEAGGPLARLDEKMGHFEVADNPLLKGEYARTIIALVKELNIDQDLKLSAEFARGELTDADFHRIHEHLHEIAESKVNRGLYVIGRPYSEAEADETARLMSVDAVAAALFADDLAAGKATAELADHRIAFDRQYQGRAKAAIEAAFRRPAVPAMPSRHPATDDSAQAEKILAAGKLPDGRAIPPAMLEALKGMPEKRRNLPPPPARPAPEQQAVLSRAALLQSTAAELDSLVNALSGGFIAPSSGGDPIGNPDAVPTGRNLYGLDPDRTPTRESYAVGKKLGEALIAEKLKTTGTYPRKVAFSLWGGEFIRTQGTNLGEIFFLLGVEPVWDSRGRVSDVRLIPPDELKRPRIDVVIQTSGQFRGAATSRMRLIDKAVRLAAAAPESDAENFVRGGSLAIARELVDNGMSPEQAKELADARIFGGVNGNFGPGITGKIQAGDRWEETAGLAESYIRNMNAVYTEAHWGKSFDGAFKAALKHTDTVVQSRSSNSWGGAFP